MSFVNLPLLAVFGALAGMPLAQAQDAASLQARHAVLREQLASNPFQRPLYLESSDRSGELKGDIYARDRPALRRGRRCAAGHGQLVRHPDPAPQREALPRLPPKQATR